MMCFTLHLQSCILLSAILLLSHSVFRSPSGKSGLDLSALSSLFHLHTFLWEPLSQLIDKSLPCYLFLHRFLGISSSESLSYEIDLLLPKSITAF